MMRVKFYIQETDAEVVRDMPAAPRMGEFVQLHGDGPTWKVEEVVWLSEHDGMATPFVSLVTKEDG